MSREFSVIAGLALRFALAGCTWTCTCEAREPPAASRAFSISACTFDRANDNVRVELTGKSSFSDVAPVLHSKRQSPTLAEYEIEFPLDAEYRVSIQYAAASPRPIEVFLDGQGVAAACRGTTGGWNASQAAWEEVGTLALAKGKHTLRLSRELGFPHITRLRFDSSVPLPKNWSLASRKIPRTLGADVPAPVPYKPNVDPAALRRAIRDLMATFGPRYARGEEYLGRLDRLEKGRKERKADVASTEQSEAELAALQAEALLANPLLDFDRLLVVKRRANSPLLGLPYNFDCNVALATEGFDDEIDTLSLREKGFPLETLFRPNPAGFVGDLDLDYDARRMLFSARDAKGQWQVYEIGADGAGLRMLTGEQPDVHCFDACYLPDGDIVFCSTAYFNAIACTGRHAGVLYRMDARGRNIRQLCFDQDQDWCPTVLHDGRVLYTRWEYTDTVHCHTRLLFRMNPDGTEQMEYYGSNSYWPNAFFYARPIPGHATKVVAVIGGHHGVPRMGELVVFDPALGRRENSGAIQRIPGWNKKPEAILQDQLVDQSWPKFLHPWPVSGKHFLVAAQPTPNSLWGIYLVDVFDNMVLVKEQPGFALLEPIPLRARPRPPVIPSRVDLASKSATVYLSDVYAGNGLLGIPRGTVKSLRLFTYHYTYPGFRGVPGTIGIDGPWDIKRVLGTVRVEPDGSALFQVPANTPISIQPQDAEGKALQLMRSWYTAMPGERVSCSGCHESRNSAPTSHASMALRRPPQEIRPWYGEERGFSYPREVQPVIDRYCVSCHDGSSDGAPPDLRGAVFMRFRSSLPGNAIGEDEPSEFSAGYVNLCHYVRHPGQESDYHLLEPMEFHADTTELVQMLRKGHQGVELDAEAWDRLVTWIDLNCPFYGTRGEMRSERIEMQRESLLNSVQRRRELLGRYAGLEGDPEAIPGPGTGLYNSGHPILPVSPRIGAQGEIAKVAVDGWPFDAAEAARRQQQAGLVTRRTVPLGGGQEIQMVLVPSGDFAMGDPASAADERPLSQIRIDRPFWMAVGEITNAQYAVFNPRHDSRVEDKPFTQYGIQGFPVNAPEQPVVRVSWQEAMGFCRWLSDRTGLAFSLPTEAQWEYACRAGTATPFSYGDLESDFAPWANMADAKLREYVTDVWSVYDPPKKPPTEWEDNLLRDARFNDGALLSVAPGRYRPNAWGLLDMHGNVAEWTRTAYRPYPYDPADERESAGKTELRVVRGGSWRDRPHRCTSSFRLAYQPYQPVFNVGFRVVCDAVPRR